MERLNIQENQNTEFKQSWLWGRGIEKVDNDFKAAGLAEPQYEESCGGVVTIIPRRNQMEGTVSGNDSESNQKNVAVNVAEELTERQKEILSLVKEDCTITSQKISQKNKVTARTIIEDMNKLQSLGILRRVGGRKTGHWEVIINH